MLSSVRHSRLRWLVVLVALCVAVVPAQGTAVCFGADGHVEIGPAGSCPCDDHGAPGDIPAGVAGLDDHAPCRDVVVATPELTGGESAPRVDVDAHEVVAPPSAARDGAHPRRARAAAAPSVAPRPPPPMRGVALLI